LDVVIRVVTMPTIQQMPRSVQEILQLFRKLRLGVT
jgi:hypothetical protein